MPGKAGEIMRNRNESKNYRNLVEKVGENQAARIYDAKAEYNKRQRAVKKEKQIEYNIAFYSRLADQYDAEKATAWEAKSGESSNDRTDRA